MPNVITIPHQNALAAYKLDRFPRSKSTMRNNPFVKVGEIPAAKSGAYDNEESFYMNEVILEAYEYQVFSVKTQTSNDGKMVKTILDYGGSRPSPLANFRILLDSDDTAISYSHKWEQPDTSSMGDVFNSINELSTKAINIVDAVQNATALLNGDLPYTNKPIRKLDFQKTYRESSYPSVDLNFTAFTNDNFIEEVYLPLMELIAFTHPKRFTAGEKDTDNKIYDTAGTARDDVAQTSQKLVEAVALSARQYTLQPPCLFNLYHQAGLYSLSNCMCTSISVAYSGPWYNTSIYEQQAFDIMKKESLVTTINRRSFPTIAKVSMKFETGERMTRDDFRNLAGNFKTMYDENDSSTTIRNSSTRG